MARNSTIIHLWDNSWHVAELNESKREELKAFDAYNRVPRFLEKSGNSDMLLRDLSCATIGELMKDEDTEVLVLPNSLYDGNEELKKQYIFSITHKGNSVYSVSTGNVVGFIGKGKEKIQTDIHIHSRFSYYDDSGRIDDSFLYYMLEKVMAINTFSYASSSGSRDPQVFDFLLFLFPRLLKEAMSQGLYKKYVYHEYNDSNIRGMVDVNRHLRFNVPANGKIAYRTREFSYDNPVTQLIRHTIEFIRRKPSGEVILHNDPDTEGYVQQIIQATPSFQQRQRQTIINENLRPIIHPYYIKFTALQNLCLRILRYEKLSYGGTGDKIHGILIDAAWLWEEYVGKVLSENGSGLRHFTKRDEPYYLFRKEISSIQRIIPDYLDKENNIVADAKYIPLLNDTLPPEKAAQVYYKTVMYMYRFEANTGFIFHPFDGIDSSVIHFTIDERPNCHFYKIGLAIKKNLPVTDESKRAQKNKTESAWRKYREDMYKREQDYVKLIDAYVYPTGSH